MNEIIQAIMERRSIRRFKREPVPKALLEEIVTAGTYAASGRNAQGTLILAVTDKKWRDAIAEENRKIGGWEEGFDPFYGAPAMLIVLADKSRPTAVYDGSLVMGDLMLAAHSLGLGSCWIHRAKEEFEGEIGRQLLRQLGIEGDYEGIGHCAVGYYDGETPPAPSRKAGRVYFVE